MRQLAVAATVLTLALPGVHAQRTTSATSAVGGVIRDSSGTPVADVEVSSPLAARAARTDTAGAFVLGGLPAGKVALRMRRLAYAPVSMELEVPARDTTWISVTLSVVAQQLNAVVVQEDAQRVRWLRGFDERRRLGIGRFVSRQDIESRQPLLLSDMLRNMPGMEIRPTTNIGVAGRNALRFTRGNVPGRDCPPQYFVDGIRATGLNIDDVLPTDIEGVELYPGILGVPAEFGNPRGNVNCGTVLIWTKRPG
jgi:hypothetical protein